MSLIKCPECGKEISDKSKYCIHCGYPISKIELNKEEIQEYKSSNITSINTKTILNGREVDFAYALDENINKGLRTAFIVNMAGCSLCDGGDILDDILKKGEIPPIINVPVSNKSFVPKTEAEVIAKLNANQSKTTTSKPQQKSSTPPQVHCPQCNSTQIQVVRRNWSFLRGFATNKTDRVCVNCGCKF